MGLEDCNQGKLMSMFHKPRKLPLTVSPPHTSGLSTNEAVFRGKTESPGSREDKICIRRTRKCYGVMLTSRTRDGPHRIP